MFRWGSLLLVLLACVACAACGGRYRGRATRTPDSRSVTRLQQQAQREMGCADPLRVVPLQARAIELEGCGQVREYAWTCAARRCAFQPMIPAILRASADLQCAPQQLTAHTDGPTHRAYFGCMRGAAYSLLCVDRGCMWSRTPETVTMSAPPPAAMVASVTPAAATSDPTLDDVAIPPPPGAPSVIAPAVPTTPASPDAVVIPPPPP